jgi:hypothetical protein
VAEAGCSRRPSRGQRIVDRSSRPGPGILGISPVPLRPLLDPRGAEGSSTSSWHSETTMLASRKLCRTVPILEAASREKRLKGLYL